ncbi:MAG: CRTAC1 family protein [Nitrospiria bacterium]
MVRGRVTRPAFLLAGAVGLLLTGACVHEPSPDTVAGFREVAARIGVTATHASGAEAGRAWYPETFGAGVCVTDVDGDDRPDLLVLTGRSWEGSKGPGVAVFRNRGDGTFQDVTVSSNLRHPSYGMGCAAADYDNDGREDVLLTGYGGVALFHNEGGGRFLDVTAAAGVSDRGWSTCAVFFDADGDGRLDLFLCEYVAWSPETDVVCRLDAGTKVFCGPDPYPPVAPRFFRNLDGGRFEDVTAKAGLAKPGKALGAALLDANADGRVDLFVANDQIPNALFLNRGDGTFEDASATLSPGPGRFGMARAGMGVAVDDEGPAVAVGNFFGEGLAWYGRDADGQWRDRAKTLGLFGPSLPFLTFGVAAADLDLDGRLDLVAANGHVDAHLARTLDGQHGSAERPLAWYRRVDGAYSEAAQMIGLNRPFVGRGLAVADLDLDGDPDLVFTENNGPVRVYRNRMIGAHWLRVRPVGTSSNRDGIGAMVSVRVGDRVQTQMVRTGSSYLSQSERAPLFGLGGAVRVDELTVRWPGGGVDRLTAVAADQRVTIVEQGAP